MSAALQATCTRTGDARVIHRFESRGRAKERRRAPGPHRVVVAVVELLVGEQQGVPDEDEDGPQDEGDEQLDVDVVPGAVELSGGTLTFAGLMH